MAAARSAAWSALKGDYRAEFLPQCEEVGALMAAGLDAGIF